MRTLAVVVHPPQRTKRTCARNTSHEPLVQGPGNLVGGREPCPRWTTHTSSALAITAPQSLHRDTCSEGTRSPLHPQSGSRCFVAAHCVTCSSRPLWRSEFSSLFSIAQRTEKAPCTPLVSVISASITHYASSIDRVLERLLHSGVFTPLASLPVQKSTVARNSPYDVTAKVAKTVGPPKCPCKSHRTRGVDASPALTVLACAARRNADREKRDEARPTASQWIVPKLWSHHICCSPSHLSPALSCNSNVCLNR